MKKQNDDKNKSISHFYLLFFDKLINFFNSFLIKMKNNFIKFNIHFKNTDVEIFIFFAEKILKILKKIYFFKAFIHL